MSQTIEITVSPIGQTTVQTKGFAGSSCRDASKFIEQALGQQIERNAYRRVSSDGRGRSTTKAAGVGPVINCGRGRSFDSGGGSGRLPRIVDPGNTVGAIDSRNPTPQTHSAESVQRAIVPVFQPSGILGVSFPLRTTRQPTAFGT